MKRANPVGGVGFFFRGFLFDAERRSGGCGELLEEDEERRGSSREDLHKRQEDRVAGAKDKVDIVPLHSHG